MAQSIKDLLEKDKWEVRTVGSIAQVQNGASIRTLHLNTGDHPAVKCGELNSKLGHHFHRCLSSVDESLIHNKKYFEHGDVLVSRSSNKIETLASASAYLGRERCLAAEGVFILKHKQHPQFLAYVLSCPFFRKQIESTNKGTLVNLQTQRLKQLKIPLPPRHVQDLVGEFLYELIKSTAELSEKLKRENGDLGSIETRYLRAGS